MQGGRALPQAPRGGPSPAADTLSVGAPLRVRAFRAVWAAQLGSNIGTWMQTVGAQWLLVDEPHASTVVALVQTATTLPFLLLALPAGALADVFDRRRYLMAVHAFMFTTAGVMAALTFADLMTPTLLLLLTFLLGTGSALSVPAWQALTPSLVPRAQLPAASALAGINQNVARAVGPAIAGVLVAGVGAGAVFGINAVSFLGGLAVMALWRRPAPEAGELGRERFGAAMRAGTRYVRHSLIVRRLLLRLMLFVVPAASLWALLPLVASKRLGLGSSGYGLLLAALGAGAVAGALTMPHVRRHLSPGRMVGGAGLAYAAVLAITAASTEPVLTMLVLAPAGFAWLTVLVHVSASMQLALPAWVRARGLATYQLTFMGGQAVAGLVWGLVASAAGLAAALGAAAVVLAVGSASIVRWPLRDLSRLDTAASAHWDSPELAVAPDPGHGPVLVQVTYLVPPENVEAFIRAMGPVGRSRRRTGAIRWNLYRDGADPFRFVEVYVVPTWEEHLRQHESRLTRTDERLEQEARALADGPPEVSHLFAAAMPLEPLEPER